VAICPCEAREAPLPIDPLDLVTFTITLDRLAEAVAEAVGASGPPAALNERCWYLGTASLDDKRLALILGLFDDRDALRELRALPKSLPPPESANEIVCLTPAFQPSPEEELALAAIHVRVARLSGFSLQGTLQELLRPPALTVPFVALSPEQEQEAVAAGFQCRWPILVTGRVAERGTNVVEVNGTERRLSPKTFPLFMRLATALYETENGYIAMGSMRGGGGLAGEGYYPSDEVYQANDRLRNALGKFRSLVEVSGGMIRLSTHPRYIDVNHQLLAQHPNDAVQALSARILRARGSEGA
jgi:hypothetical protein